MAPQEGAKTAAESAALRTEPGGSALDAFGKEQDAADKAKSTQEDLQSAKDKASAATKDGGDKGGGDDGSGSVGV